MGVRTAGSCLEIYFSLESSTQTLTKLAGIAAEGADEPAQVHWRCLTSSSGLLLLGEDNNF